MRGATVGAFALVLASALAALVAGVVLTAALSASMSARAAGEALVWMAAGQLLVAVASVVGFGRLARRWSGAAASWWSLGLLGVLVLAAAAMLFVLAMIGMNR